jgi:malate permease and related proteins
MVYLITYALCPHPLYNFKIKYSGGIKLNTFLLIFSEFLVLYLIGFIGFFAKKYKILCRHTDHVLTKLILFITLPALILFAFDIHLSFVMVKSFVWLIILSVFILAAASLIAFLLVKILQPSKSKSGIFQALIIFGNQGFIGIALCYILFQEEGVLYATIFNMFYLLLIWSYGIYLIAKEKVEIPLTKLILNPGFIATILGLMMSVLPYHYPVFISKTLSSVGLMTIPLSMILIGSIIANIHYKEFCCLLQNRFVWIAIAFKLVLIPLILFIFIPTSVPVTILLIAIILTATPSAPTIAMYAHKYCGDVSFASIVVFLTTIFALFTIPLIICIFLFFNPFCLL